MSVHLPRMTDRLTSDLDGIGGDLLCVTDSVDTDGGHGEAPAGTCGANKGVCPRSTKDPLCESLRSQPKSRIPLLL